MMYQELPGFDTPKGDSLIWRYMDFTKLVSLLEKNALFFARGDKFNDAFEGKLAKLNVDHLKNLLEGVAKGGSAPASSASSPGKAALRDLIVKVGADKTLETLLPLVDTQRLRVAINCWHLSGVESEAMWKLYLRSNEGIAIQSSILRLQEALAGHRDPVYLSRVQYIDFSKTKMTLGNHLYPFLYKRQSFEHEKEVRAIITTLPIGADGKTQHHEVDHPSYAGGGVSVPVDLATLIETIHIAPTAPGWILELVQSVVKRYGLKCPVRGSELDQPPLY